MCSVVKLRNQFILVFGFVFLNEVFFSGLCSHTPHILAQISVVTDIVDIEFVTKSDIRPREDGILSQVLVAPTRYKIYPHYVLEIAYFFIDPVVRFLALRKVLNWRTIHFYFWYFRQEDLDILLSQVEYV